MKGPFSRYFLPRSPTGETEKAGRDVQGPDVPFRLSPSHHVPSWRRACVKERNILIQLAQGGFPLGSLGLHAKHDFLLVRFHEETSVTSLPWAASLLQALVRKTWGRSSPGLRPPRSLPCPHPSSFLKPSWTLQPDSNFCEKWPVPSPPQPISRA